MSVPKKRTSKSRKGMRGSHLALRLPLLSLCPQCKRPKLPHRVCPFCGTYDGREVLKVKTKKGGA